MEVLRWFRGVGGRLGFIVCCVLFLPCWVLFGQRFTNWLSRRARSAA